MNNQYKVSLCAHVERGKVRYYKEYTIGGRIVKTEPISCGEFVRLLCERRKNDGKAFFGICGL